MPWGYSGHDTGNDDLLGSGIPDPVGRQGNGLVYGGWEGYTDQNGQYTTDPETGAKSSYEAATNRYQKMGADSWNRAAPQADYTQANQDRQAAYDDRTAAGMARQRQNDALGLMEQAAYGDAPSRAELLGRSMTDQSLQAQMAGAASARGGALAQSAAMHNAANGAAQYQQQATQNAMAMRADEMARARDAFMGGASTIRGQDYQGAAQAADMMGRSSQQAQFQAQMQGQQNALNQQNQQYYEGQAHDVNTQMLGVGMAKAGLAESKRQYDAASRERKNAREDAAAGQIMSSATGWLGDISDITAKQDVRALGRGAPMGRLQPWMPPNAFPASIILSDAKSKQEQRALGQAEGMKAAMNAQLQAPPSTQASADRDYGHALPAADAPPSLTENSGPSYSEGAGGIVRDDPYGLSEGGYGGGIIHDNPYGDSGKGIIRENPYGAPTAAAPQAKQTVAGSDTSPFMKQAVKYGTPMVAGAMGIAPAAPMGYAPPGAAPTVGVNDYRAGLHYSDERSKKELKPLSDDELLALADQHIQGVRAESARRDAGARPMSARDAALMEQANRELGNVHAESKRRESAPTATAAAEARSAEPAQMMDALGGGIAYRYKPGVPGTDPGEQHYGTTTQDLRQTPMGASMVKRDPASGYEAIDTREAVGPVLASLGNLNQRLRKLEGR